MKRLPIILIFLAVAVSGCTSTASSMDSSLENGTEALSESQESSTYTIKYTESGFNPKRLVIREGDKVRWIARTGEGLELVFPQSGDCSSETAVMNSCGTMNEYGFKFQEAGTYNFYSRGSRVHRGMVVVNRRGLQ